MPLRRVVDPHEALRFGVWKRLQQDAVHDAENGGVCPNPERKRNDRNNREAGSLDEAPQGVQKILTEMINGVAK